MNCTNLIRLTAAVCTTASYLPQLQKCWQTRSANDLSLKMFLILATGIALWVLYGVLQGDAVIILANAISLCLLGGILYFKLRGLFGPQENRSGETAQVRQEILNRSAVNIRERGAAYRKAGWKGFDPSAAPYTAEQVRKEREVYRSAA